MNGPTRGSKSEDEAARCPGVIQRDHGQVAWRDLKISERCPDGVSAGTPAH